MPRKKSPDTPMIRTQDGRGEWYQSQKDYNAKYEREVTESVRLRVPKGWRDKIKRCAINSGAKSVNSMILRLIQDEMERVGID